MKKIYTIVCTVLLAVLLFVGFFALTQRTQSAAGTSFTFGSLFDGTYFQTLGNRYKAHFEASEALANANTSLKSFYAFSFGGKDDKNVSLVIDMNSNAANGGASLNPTQPATTPTEPGQTVDPAVPTEPPPPTAEEPDEYADAVVENLGQAIIIGNRAMEIPNADYDVMEDYAAAVTAIANKLGTGVRTFSIITPNSAELYTPKDYHTGDNSQTKMISFCYEKMGDAVKTVDAYSALKAHKDEYIYFRTDHHWTQLGAYYAYTAFCEQAGLQAESLSAFEQSELDNFVGSMYSYLSDYSQASVLRDNPDTVHIYRPFVNTSTSYYTSAALDDEYPIGCISYIGDNVSNKYMCYLGGDHPITIIETDVNGPVCMLLKESYGNSFAPWLTSHYSKIIVIDPREFNRDGKPSLNLAEFAAQQKVKDCIILNYPMMINSEYYVAWLNRLVE